EADRGIEEEARRVRGTPRGRFELPGSCDHGVAGGGCSTDSSAAPYRARRPRRAFAFGGRYLRARPGNSRAAETRRHAAGCVIRRSSMNRGGRARERFVSWSFTISLANASGFPVISRAVPSAWYSR